MGRSSLKMAVLASVAVVALDQAAYAQQTNPNSVVESITVTATRQAELLSRVPQSISAFTPAKMDTLGVKNFGDIARFTPGVHFNEGSNSVVIRGIGSGTGAGTTGIYIDDTPVQTRGLGFGNNNALPSVFDLQRVEVLRGPQGTLFGAGSEGGTVRYITVQPGLTDYSAHARAEFSNTQYGAPSYEVGAAAGGPIIADKLGFRVSVWGRRDSGWIDKVDYHNTFKGIDNLLDSDINRTDTYVVRGALTWQPIPNLLITPTVEYQNRNTHDSGDYWVGLSNRDEGKFVTATPDRIGNPDQFTLVSLRGEYTFDGIDVISNTSYFNRHNPKVGYSGTMYNLGSYYQWLIDPSQPGGPVDPMYNPCPQCNSAIFPIVTNTTINMPGFVGNYRSPARTTNWQENITQELRLQSSDPTARFSWVAGVFYQFNTQRSLEAINDPMLDEVSKYLWGEDIITAWGSGLLPNGDGYRLDTTGHDRQVAGFANVTYEVFDGLKIIAGARMTRSHFDFASHGSGPENFGDSHGGGKQSEDSFTPKVGLSWQATDDDMFYATYSKGYRVGGANRPIPVAACAGDLKKFGIKKAPDTYGSDTVSNYEIGSKDSLFDGRMSLDSSFYYMKWKNIQQSVYLPVCGIQYTANLGQAVSQGFDTHIQFQVNEALGLELSLGYTDAYYSQSNHTTPSPSSPITVNKGDSLGATPWKVAAAIQYNLTVLDHDAFIRVDDEFTSAPNRLSSTLDPVTVGYDPALVANPATNFMSARFSVDMGNYNLALFMDNVLDAHPQLNLSDNGVGGLNFQANTLRPRTMGLTVDYRY